MTWTLLLPRNILFLSVPCLKIQYLYAPSQDLASTCLCSLSLPSGKHTVSFTFPLAAALLCSCNHVLQLRHVRGTCGDLNEPWKRLTAASALMFSLSLLPFSSSLYLSIPPCLSSTLFTVLPALHSKESTVTDPPVHTNYREEKGDSLSIYRDQKLMKCVEPCTECCGDSIIIR